MSIRIIVSSVQEAAAVAANQKERGRVKENSRSIAVSREGSMPCSNSPDSRE